MFHHYSSSYDNNISLLTNILYATLGILRLTTSTLQFINPKLKRFSPFTLIHWNYIFFSSLQLWFPSSLLFFSLVSTFSKSVLLIPNFLFILGKLGHSLTIIFLSSCFYNITSPSPTYSILIFYTSHLYIILINSSLHHINTRATYIIIIVIIKTSPLCPH